MGHSSARYTGSGISVGSSAHVNAIAAETGFVTSSTTLGVYVINAVAAVPTASPGPAEYVGSTTVALKDSTPGSTIYYTLDGSAPTIASPVYSGTPLTIKSTTTVKAFAVASNYKQSAVSTWVYTIIQPAPTPVFTPAESSYPCGIIVYISDALPGANVRYTLDGTTPKVNSIQNVGPITISSTTTLKAAAFFPGYATSAIASNTFTISIPNRIVSTIAGTHTLGYSGDGGLATNAKLNLPHDLAIDKAGDIYIADTGNNVVRKLTASTGIITTVAGNGTAGYAGDGAAATKSELNQPLGLALDSAGNLYIADSVNQVVRKVDAATGLIGTVVGKGKIGTLSIPGAIAVDSANNIYIGENGSTYPTYLYNLVVKANLTAGTLTVVAGGNPDQDPPSGYYANQVGLMSVTGLALDSSGDFYVAEQNSVWKVSSSSGILTTIADGYYGQGYSGDGWYGSVAGLYNAQGIAVDGAGNALIADSSNNVIRDVFADSGIITTVAGNGFGAPSLPPGAPQGGYTGDGGPAADAEFNYPSGIALDSQGNMYIADTYNNVIRKVTVTTP